MRILSLRYGIRFAFVILSLALVVVSAVPPHADAQTQPETGNTCRIESINYKGWQAQQISNHWVQLVIVPQNGGRLIQVTFAGHEYLFNNPQLAGKYFPPTNGKWFNYGGDKLWLLPEGNDDEQHWVGNSDLVDDGHFTFRKVSEGNQCEVELTSPADPQTGIQFTRTIHLDADSPRIRFHAVMKNISGHTVNWSMQSVSQYNTTDPSSPNGFNHNFWTFTPANSASSYLNRYHVRYGPAQNSAVGVRDDGLFNVHYVHMAAELWVDSPDGWLAVVDGSSKYAMVERFEYESTKEYPGKASVIFWTNGAGMELNKDGIPSLPADPDAGPSYLEAELNSPMCKLRAGESCTFDTEWFPTRAGDEFHGVTDPGILLKPLHATEAEGKVKLSGQFGVFFAGHLVARFYDNHGSFLGIVPVADVSPTDAVSVDKEVLAPGKAARVSLHLLDESGLDRGSLNEVQIGPLSGKSEGAH
ncbi:MAG TPA: hypothetical protein VFA90_06350 [Terriglobales bacterium]|nr:hypothetical protein [Terriglobales bacterium]